jgi:hypothetical protein
MRGLFVVAVAVLAAACTPHPKATCETTPTGVRLSVDPRGGAYRDIVWVLRTRPDEMVSSASAYSGRVTVGTHTPVICKTDHAFAKATSIRYPSRSRRHVGANLDLYFDRNDRVKVAEFYVVPVTP